jgi:autotransporter-associated beta strand protein
LNTRGVALSGGHDMTVVNGNLFYSNSSGGGRTVNVLNPTTCLFVSSNLADPANSSLLIGGKGFLVLTGTGNQIAFSSPQNIYLNDGVLRVTTGNFVPTNSSIAFRGGTLEYDVSGGSASISFNVASGPGNITWSSTSAGSAGESQTTDVGGGGFSAFSATPGNSLTVNLGGAAAQMDWNAPGFITTYHALKFGSLKSNASVDFQNPIGLGSVPGLPYRTRNIHVTRGAGNPADKTRLNGVISGIAGYDLVKTGSGVLETTAPNTYDGNTIVREGELRILATNTGSGAYVVAAGTLVFGANQNVSAITVGGGAFASLAADGNRRLVTGSLHIAGQEMPAGRFDLTNNAVVVDYTSFSPLATLAAQIRSGYASGAWTGNGITSSIAAATPGHGVGFGEASQVFSLFPANFAGQLVDSTSVLMRYTLRGDANLDQSVNIADFSALAANFNSAGSWARGDFDYDGLVGIGDFSVLASNFNRSVAARTTVPEPASMLAAALLVAGYRRPRRTCPITSG